nr:DsbA family protein [Streptomyces boncukensis]
MVHDFVCAASYLGFTRAVRAVRRYEGEGGRARLVLRPYRIAPGAPAAGEPLFEVHRRQRGEEAARRIRADTALGAADGLRFRFDLAVFTNTFEAHLLRSRAAAQGRGEAMTERLFRAYFTDGLHLADPAALGRLAAEAGVRDGGGDGGAEALRAELARTRALGSDTGPVFRFADGRELRGDQPEDALLAALRAAGGKWEGAAVGTG